MTIVTIEEAFKRCTKTTKGKDGWFVRCKLGSWAVAGPNRERVMHEAKHYFWQYLADGEYNAILASKPTKHT